MANNNISSLSLTEADFFSLKESFKNFLRGQDEFKDYDLDGSAMNMLLEVMAQNSYRNAFMTNMLYSEGFIDSAQLRSSLLSHAKELNYLPRSVRSAKARVRVTFEASGEAQPYTIPKGSQFATLIKSESYTFSTPEPIQAISANNTFTFETDLYEGIYVKDVYVFSGDETQKFKLTNRNVDIRSITVVVYEDGSTTPVVYNRTTTLLDLKGDSKVYFLQASENNTFEVFFGDNVLGRKPKNNATIVIDYRISSGPKGNGARAFSVDFDPTNANELLSTPILEILEVAKNGVDEESNESIRYYAPRSFQVQERAITASDYEILLKTEFPEINAVSVYGGEELDPPRFGRVYLAVDIADVEGLPEIKKDEYTQFLTRRSPFSIKPTIVEPVFTYIGLNILARYNLNLTTNSIARIKTIVTNAVMNYNQKYLNKFNSTFRLSKLTSDIDNSDLSIISNATSPVMYKKLNPTIGSPTNIEIDFAQPLFSGSPAQQSVYSADDMKTVYSTAFRYRGDTCVFEDDGNGKIRIVKYSQITRTTITEIGTVDYTLGKIMISNVLLDAYSGAHLKFYAVPADKDIYTAKNVFLSMEVDEVVINVEGIRE